MAQFKKVTHTYIDRKICEFWGNMVKNLDEPVRDSDFFSPVANALPHDKVVSLVLAAFEDEELDEMTSAHERRARLDLDRLLKENVISQDVYDAIINYLNSLATLQQSTESSTDSAGTT